MTWHYSHRMPTGKLVKLGVWWAGAFVGAAIFARACKNAGLFLGIEQTEICELSRVALDKHEGFFVTEVVAAALRKLRRACPGLRVVVSFADTGQGHEGRIYQAGNWLYAGRSEPQSELRNTEGKTLHKRSYTGGNYGRPRAAIPAGYVWAKTASKHRYYMPLDGKMRKQLLQIAQPYPRTPSPGEPA